MSDERKCFGKRLGIIDYDWFLVFNKSFFLEQKGTHGLKTLVKQVNPFLF
jgi:hypothetical protein